MKIYVFAKYIPIILCIFAASLRINHLNTTITYRHDLDFLKGLAIMAVVLYHAGWCKSGYLGVDVFFVINGYLVVPKLMNEISEGRFRYWHFLEKKLFMLSHRYRHNGWCLHGRNRKSFRYRRI